MGQELKRSSHGPLPVNSVFPRCPHLCMDKLSSVNVTQSHSEAIVSELVLCCISSRVKGNYILRAPSAKADLKKKYCKKIE